MKKKSIYKYHKIFNEFTSVTQLLPTPVYWLDINAVLVGGNEHFYQLLGINSDYIGYTGYDVYPYDIAYYIVEHDKRIMQTGIADSQEEPTIDILTGRKRYFNAFKAPVRDENGEVVGLVGTLIEITAQKEAERMLMESHSQFRTVSAQVAHDIGSPLAALQMIVPHCNTLPENTRNVLSKSATRIADIAEHFLGQFKPKDEKSTIGVGRTPTLISAEILEILTEKKYEYSKLPIELDSNISQSGAFAFININQLSFKRMISNLINNAIDALNGKLGRVIVHLHEIDNQVQITVEDNGNGMPEAVKEKILNNIQVTAGKVDGHGIGFTQIRDTLADNDGKLDIKSKPNVGTKIILTFPKIILPDWMAESIELHNDDLVVILDDDDSIHGAWEARFEKSAPNIARQHFKQGNQAVEFINNLSQEEKQNVFLLTDYELLRQDLTGLEVIERTGITRSILVTSHHNNTEVREQAKQTNTKILPKPLASVVQINVINRKRIDDIKKINLINIEKNKKSDSPQVYKKPKIFYDLDATAPLIQSPLYWLDTDIIVRGANEACLEATGRHGSLDIFVGKRFDEFHPVEVAEGFIKNTQLVIDSKKTIKVEEWAKDFKTQRIRYYETIKSPLFDEDRTTIVGVLCNAIEITRQKEAERLKLESQNKQLEQEKNFRQTAAQVAHDIGSPLAALQMIVPHCDTLPENTRNVLSKSATRIADIAEHFLGQFKPKDEESTIGVGRTPTLISAEILEILTEKKYEYSKLPIELDSNISQSGAFAFININQLSFKRMISNLINNAIDALNGKLGRVIVHLHEIDNQVQIIVEDNGKGMPEAVKEKILNNIQVTAGKVDGHGIGFTQIRDTLADNDGKLDIKSQPNVGTKIILTFPKIILPDWMAESIELHNDDLVVILDDDDSIHGAWEARFEKSAPNIARQHFKQGNRAVEFINNLSQEEKQNVFLLTDYELLRQDLTGLEVIERTGITSSILVTSHHNNTEVREQAKQTNTKILPKQLASEIPINILQNLPPQLNIASQFKKVDLVILDDDKNLVNAILIFIADDVVVDKYHIPQDFLDNMHQYDKRTKFLIDNQYSNEGITGIEIAKQMHDLGYINLNLFTGEFFEEDSGIPDYLNVVSKHDVKAIQYLLDKQ